MEQNPQGGEKEKTTFAFTTKPKKPRTTINISRKGSVVKERCRQLTEIALNLFPDRVISEEDLVYLIQEYIGTDKETVRSYLGYRGHIRAGRCGDNRVVGLVRKGYLEVLGFMHKIVGRRWVIHAQTILSSQDMNEAKSLVSNEKISFSLSQPQSQRKESESDVVTATNELEEEDTEKERNFSPMIYGEEATAILTAKPTPEPDKSKVKWPELPPIIPDPEPEELPQE